MVNNIPNTIDVVIPVYRNRLMLADLILQIEANLQNLTPDYHLYFVDDCGNDGSKELLREFQKSNPAVSVIENERNRGQHASIARGLRESTAEMVIVMDADLQHPPEYLGRLVEKLQSGFDVVIAYGKVVRSGVLRRALTACWYRSVLRFLPSNAPGELLCYSVLSRKAVKAYLAAEGCGKLYLGVITRLRLPTAYCEIIPRARPNGRSSYSWLKLMRLALTAARYHLFSKV